MELTVGAEPINAGARAGVCVLDFRFLAACAVNATEVTTDIVRRRRRTRKRVKPFIAYLLSRTTPYMDVYLADFREVPCLISI